MSQYCPKCQTVNVDEAKFCKDCGTSLIEEIIIKESINYSNMDLFVIFIVITALGIGIYHS